MNYYIRVDMLVNGEWKPYGYFDELIITDYFQNRPEFNISTVSDKEYAKKYRYNGWAEKKIQEIYRVTKDNIFLYSNDTYIYKFYIVEE